MVKVDEQKLKEYLEKTNQEGLAFIDEYRKSNWTIPQQLCSEYQSMYEKDNDFIIPKEQMEKFAELGYMTAILSFNYKLPITYKEFYKWFDACHSVAGTYDVYLKLTPID